MRLFAAFPRSAERRYKALEESRVDFLPDGNAGRRTMRTSNEPRQNKHEHPS